MKALADARAAELKRLESIRLQQQRAQALDIPRPDTVAPKDLPSTSEIRSWMKRGSTSLQLRGLPPAYVDGLSSDNVRKVYEGIMREHRADGARKAKAQSTWLELSRDARKKGFKPSFSGPKGAPATSGAPGAAANLAPI